MRYVYIKIIRIFTFGRDVIRQHDCKHKRTHHELHSLWQYVAAIGICYKHNVTSASI